MEREISVHRKQTADGWNEEVKSQQKAVNELDNKNTLVKLLKTYIKHLRIRQLLLTFSANINLRYSRLIRRQLL